jgi:four helix bundle protein
MKVTGFEELIAWRKARELTRLVYLLTMAGGLAKDFGLREQMRRAAVSIMSNIAEGFERGSSAEFHQFIVIAKGSCAELRSQLYVALDVGHITQAEFAKTYTLAVEVSKILGGLKAAIKRRREETR